MSFTALQPQLTARLTERLPAIGTPGGVHILSAAEIASVDGTHPVPAVIIMFDDYSVAETQSSGRGARIGQTWLAIVAVRQVGQIKSGAPALAQAGDIADAVLDALMGWTPAGSSKPLHLAKGPKAAFTDGYYYLPLAFDAEIVRRASNPQP